MAKPKQQAPALIPRAVLFGNPERAQPQIAPDGTRLAYLAPSDGVLNVWVGPRDGSAYRPVTADTDRGIRRYFWAEDSRHICYLQDVGGNENWRLYDVDLDTGTVRDLTPFAGVQAQILAYNKEFPQEIIVGLNRDNPRVHDAYRLDLQFGELTLLAKNPGTVAGWVVDRALQVRGASAFSADGGKTLLVRDSADDDWRALLTWDPDDAGGSHAVGFTKDGKSLYLRDSRNANAARLVQVNVASGKSRVLAKDPEYDVTGVVLHPDTYKVELVAFTRARKEWVVIDKALEADITAIRALHPGDFEILSRDNADTTWVVAFTAADGPVAYFLYDRATREGTFLFDSRPDLKAYTLAPMEPISFAARDGLTIHGYLTRPPGSEGTPLPTVLRVHGGPDARDVWGFDPGAQWLANRGYACLQINFRGSTGYGKAFHNAGIREWGRHMHDDLVDAVAWAVAEGIADPARVAIYGASYGGYAALVGAAFTPDLFCCAVDVCGPSNIVTLLQTTPPYWSAALPILYRRIGDPERDAEFLRSRSPLFRADQIHIPMLIAQGANDPRVPQAEAEQIVAALVQNGVEHEYLLFPDEGHGFVKPENQFRFYAAAEQFFARHLGGRAEKERATPARRRPAAKAHT